MSHTSNWISTKRSLFLCGLVFAAYQLNRFVEIDGWQSLSVSLRESEIAPPDAYHASLLGMRMSTPVVLGGSSPLLSASYTSSTAAADDSRMPTTTVARRSAEKPAVATNLRIASWALNGFGPEQFRDRELAAVLVATLQPFDVIALQQVRCTERDFLPYLVTLLNQQGRAYEYMLAPTSGVASESFQSVFLFDTNRVVTDRTQLYTIADPEHRFQTRPAVAWFRASGVPPERAWTFSLVNVSIDLQSARQEVYELPRLIAAVAADGRGEDDVIVAGLLQADRSYLQGMLAGKSYWYAAGDQRTDVHGKYQTSHLILDPQVTSEAVLRGGVIDFLRLNNLRIAQAERISPHLPVHAEFSPWEGGFQ